MNLKFPREKIISSFQEIFETPLVSGQISGIRLSLLFYILAFGLYGYGSDLESQDLVTFLPLLSGLGISIYFAFRPSHYFDRWTYQVHLKVKHVVAYLIVLGSLFSTSYRFIKDELVGDELAYLQLSVTHSLELVERLDFLNPETEIGPLLQLFSLLVISMFVVPVVILSSFLPIRTAILGGAIIVTALQVAYAFMGGWGWGYAKVAWLPYLLPITLFGPETIVIRASSLFIVAIGFCALFFTLKNLNISFLLRSLIIFGLVSLPVPALFFTSMDHVIYFLAFALPSLPLLLTKPKIRTLEGVLLLLSIGTLFRISISFLLIALALWVLVEKPFREAVLELWAMIRPSLLLLVPYGVGIVFNTPVLSISSDSSAGLELDTEKVMAVLSNQLGFLELSIVSIVLFITILFLRLRAPLVMFLVITLGFYFFILRGLVGEPKYSVEWGLSFLALALAALSMSSSKVPESVVVSKSLRASAFLVATAVILGNLGAIVGQFMGDAGFSEKQFRTYSPIGYSEVQNFLALSRIIECVPVGGVYGAGNEILANRSLGTISFARESFRKLQVDQNFGPLSSDLATSSSFKCFYGSQDSFLSIESQSWENWAVTFRAEHSRSETPALVLQRVDRN